MSQFDLILITIGWFLDFYIALSKGSSISEQYELFHDDGHSKTAVKATSVFPSKHKTSFRRCNNVVDVRITL